MYQARPKNRHVNFAFPNANQINNQRNAPPQINAPNPRAIVADPQPTVESTQMQAIIRILENQQNMISTKATNKEMSGVRMPEVVLPTLDGNIKNYKTFRESFQQTLNRTKTATIAKFILLRSKLSGDALETLNALAITENNYTVAWKYLDEMYDNDRVSMEENFKAILEAKEIDPRHNDAILKFLHNMDSALFNLERLQATYESVMVFWLMDAKTLSRFDDQQEDNTKMPSIMQLRTFFNINTSK